MRWTPVTALLALVVASCGGGGRPPRHLLLVTFDTTRADHIGCYGYRGAETPTLDGLAASGARFAQAYTTAPLTLPAHSSLLTGTYPTVHGVRDNGRFRLSEKAVTLAETLHEQGFETAAFVSSFVLARTFGLAQGFDTYDDRVQSTFDSSFGFAERSAKLVTDAALAWLGKQDLKAERAFLWLHYFDPHAPYRPPAPYPARYDGEIAFADAQLGRLLGEMRTRGVLDDTLVVVTADHGESLGEHGEQTHGVFVYDATAHIPLVMAHPSVTARRAVEEPVSIVDVMPTALALLGVAAPPGVQGRSLVPALSGRRDGSEAIYTESECSRHMLGWAPLYAVRSGRWKLVLAPRPELYDLVADPGETRNVWEEQPAVRDDLRARLEQMMHAGVPIVSERVVLDEASAQRLKALGYVSGDEPTEERGLRDPKDGIAIIAKRERAIIALGEGRLDEAEHGFRDVLAENANDEIAWGMLGMIALRREDWAEAETWLRRVVTRSESPPALYNLAMAVYGSRHAEEAENLLGRALALDPAFAPALRVLALLHQSRAENAIAARDRERARSELDHALDYCRKILATWYGDPGPLDQIRTLETTLRTRRDALG